MSNSKVFLKRVYSLFLISCILTGALPIFAQKKTANQQVASNQSKQVQSKCSGAWTGTITYTRTQTMTDNKTTKRVSGRGEDKRDWEMKYDYTANVGVIESTEKNGSSEAKASIVHSMTSTEKIVAKEENSCDRGKTWQTMTGESTSKTETTGSAKGEQANVNIGVNTDGTYTISVAIPQIKGKTSGEQTSTFSGQCTKKEGKTLPMPPTETSIDGNSLTSEGKDRINPDDPNHLSGSYTKTWQNVTETISWNLQKCGAPLRLTDLKFEQMKFPNWDDWKEIEETKGTIDGNLVRIKAKVFNASGETKFGTVKFKETYKGDKWDGARADAPLGDTEVSVRLDPGEEKEIEMVWDSSGYAWFDDGRPRLLQRVKAELEENGKKADEMTKNLKVAPKPLILVHGIWSDYRVWEPLYQNLLTTSHSYDWKAYSVGEKASYGAMSMGGKFLSDWYSDSVYDNADQLARYIRYAQENSNAWHVDMVAHSTGGLVARLYLHKLMSKVPDGRPQVKHLMMLGTPNNGAKCIEAFLGKFEIFKKELKAARELTDEEMRNFNKYVTNTNGTKIAALVGNPVPVICGGYEWNDGFVTVDSAKYGVSDFAYSNDLNHNLVDTRNFGNFVLPHLVTGPKGTYPKPVKSDPNDIDRWKMNGSLRNSSENNFVNASYSANDFIASSIEGIAQSFSKEVKLAPKQTVEIEMPVEASPNLGLTFMAKPEVSVSLVNDKGIVVGKNTSDSPLANTMFRTLFIKNPVSKGVWKLKIENTSEFEQMFLGYNWSLANVPPGTTPVAE